MAYTSSNYEQVYGFAGSKGSGKDTLAKAVKKANDKFLILHFADRLKDISSKVFKIPRINFDDVVLKESPLPEPIKIDDYLYQLNSETGLNIKPKGLVATTHRELLQFIGTDYVRSECDNYWIDYIVNLIKSLPKIKRKVIVADVRFQNEVDAIHSVGGKVFRIIRENWATSGAHGSEKGDYTQDMIFYFRDGDLSIFEHLVPRLAKNSQKYLFVFDYQKMKPLVDDINSHKISIQDASKKIGYPHTDLNMKKNVFKICAKYYGCQAIASESNISARKQHIVINSSKHKRCGKCKLPKTLDNFHYSSTAWDKLASTCKMCRSNTVDKPLDLQSFFKKSLRFASYRKKMISVTPEQLVALYNNQAGLCYYTGKQMTMLNGSRDKVSIDRKDSSLGYTIDNIVLCRYCVNVAKGSLSIDDFKQLVTELHNKLDKIE